MGASISYGSTSVSLPLIRYAVHTLMVSNPDSTSALVINNWVTPLIITEYFRATRSSHPQRRGLPVVAPYSCPLARNSSPVFSDNSVGNGPLPTRVQYALKIPNTSPTLPGAIPSPVQAPAQMVLDEVTKGYDPKSISSI